MAKDNPANPNRPLPRTMEEQKRIDDAREHYRTRADRRRKGVSQIDTTKYYPVDIVNPHGLELLAGSRRNPKDSLFFMQMAVQSKSSK